MKAIDQGVATTSQVGDMWLQKVEDHILHTRLPLVQHPSRGDSSFHSPMERRVDDIARPDFGPNAPFWDTLVGQAIASFGSRLNSPEDKEERRQYHDAIFHAKEIDR